MTEPTTGWLNTLTSAEHQELVLDADAPETVRQALDAAPPGGVIFTADPGAVAWLEQHPGFDVFEGGELTPDLVEDAE